MITMIWALMGIALLIGQFALGIFDLLFPAIAALLAAVATAVIPGFAGVIWLQVVLWVAASFASVWAFRKRFKHLFRGDVLLPERNSHSGEQARVIETIEPGKPGRISFKGTTWTASSIDEILPEGSTAFILEQDGMSFVVSAHLLDDDKP